jgi:two-component system sensor histidine kinase MtrB
MTGRARRAAERVADRIQRAGSWLLGRWRRSLQLRVAATTLLVCGSVVVLVGVLLMHQITQGVLNNKLRAAEGRRAAA